MRFPKTKPLSEVCSGFSGRLLLRKSQEVSRVCVFPGDSAAFVRIRIKGEKSPVLLLELLDDERSQTFLAQVKSAQEQGETPMSTMVKYLFCDVIFI